MIGSGTIYEILESHKFHKSVGGLLSIQEIIPLKSSHPILL